MKLNSFEDWVLKQKMWVHVILSLCTYFIWIFVYLYCKYKDNKIKKEKEILNQCKEIKKDETIESKNNIKNISFYVVGESFDNEDGVNRQKRIKQVIQNYKKSILIKEDLYCGFSDKDILESNLEVEELSNIAFNGEIKEYNYNGERAFAIYIEDTDKKQYQVGNIARKDLKDFISIIENHEISHASLYIHGGKIKKVEYNYEKNKDDVIIKNLDYGIEIKIYYK